MGFSFWLYSFFLVTHYLRLPSMFGGGGGLHPGGVGGVVGVSSRNRPEVLFEEGKYVQVRNPNHHESNHYY